MLQLALVGCAHIHTPSFVRMIKQRPGVAVKYVWDPTEARASKWAGELAAKIVRSPAKIWSDVDIAGVVICSETDLHKKLVLAGAGAGKHLFVEKPLGVGSRDSQAMADAVEKAGVKFQTGYFFRSQPVHRFIKEQIAKGNLGTITRVRGSTVHEGSLGGWFDAKPNDPAMDWRWMADPKRAGCGAFGDLGTHSLDILMWLLGDVVSVAAEIKSVTGRYGECDETGEALLKFAGGAVGTLSGAWLDHANPLSLLVSGTEGHAAVINGQLYFMSKKVEGADGKAPWTNLPPALPHAFELFLDALEGKPAELVNVRDAAKRVAVMEAAYAAARKGKWVAPR